MNGVDWEVLKEFWSNKCPSVEWTELEKAVKSSIIVTDSHRIASIEWLDKTEWVQEKDNWPFPSLGMHRADVMKKYIEHLELNLAKITAANLRGVDITFKPLPALKHIKLNLVVDNTKKTSEE